MPTYRVNSLHEYDTIVQSGELVVVDFYADWCGPCQRISPFVEQLSNHYSDINFIKVNCGQNNDIAAAEGVRSMPTFFFYSGGELVANMVGADQNKLHSIVDSLSR